MVDAGLDYQMSLLHLLCNDVFPYCLNLIFYTVHELTQTWIFNVVAFVVNFEFTNPIDIWKDIWRCFPLLLFHNVDGPAIRTISLDNSFSYESRNLSILCFIYSLWWLWILFKKIKKLSWSLPISIQFGWFIFSISNPFKILWCFISI